MDVYVEQLIAIKKNSKTYLCYAGITIATLILMAITLMLFGNIAIVAIFLILYGAFKLYSMFNIEYEYIVTNSTIDIDKIIAKSSRKRMTSFDLTAVLRIEKYNGHIPSEVSNNCFFACNENDPNAYILHYKQEGQPQKAFVFAPDDRIKAGMKSTLPRHIGENLN